MVNRTKGSQIISHVGGSEVFASPLLNNFCDLSHKFFPKDKTKAYLQEPRRIISYVEVDLIKCMCLKDFKNINFRFSPNIPRFTRVGKCK